MNFPVQYLGANVPQAWPAGSIPMLLQAILGLMPGAPRSRLNLDPCSPRWLPDITIRNLRVGERKLDIRFWREKNRKPFRSIERRATRGFAAKLRDRAGADC